MINNNSTKNNNYQIPTLGQEIELEVQKWANEGVAVAKYHDVVVFVSDALPGEKIIAKVTEAKAKTFLRASTIKVLEASKNRQKHIWTEAEYTVDVEYRIGGASMGYAKLDYQRILKTQIITENLLRFAKISPEFLIESPDEDNDDKGLAWRSRLKLHFDSNNRLGHYAHRSKNVIVPKNYPLLNEQGQNYYQKIINKKYAQARSVQIVASNNGECFDIANNDKKIYLCHENVGQRKFEFDARGFWQVHNKAPEILSQAVADSISDDLFFADAPNLDLYGGVALFAAAIIDRKDKSASITTVESVKEATKYAAKNLADAHSVNAYNSLVHKFLLDEVKKATASKKSAYKKASIILDPPRAGLGKDVISLLSQLSPAQMILLSCDSVSFARDTKDLITAGFTMVNMRVFDLFPNTHHVEIMSVWV